MATMHCVAIKSSPLSSDVDDPMILEFPDHLKF